MTLAEAKAQARALRAALQGQGRVISHAQALEMIAHQHGARDWNALHARLSQQPSPPDLAQGGRVRGHYLGQPFAGRIIGLSGPASHRLIEIRFDQPVDVVRFQSFSNLRHQIRAVIDPHGCSHERTSDGRHQLVVRPEGARP